MKYRILTSEELNHLEDDLKHFLIVNGVHAEEWERLNKEDAEKAIELVEIFSDTVLQKVYEKIQFLEFRSLDSCILFHFNPKEVELISMQKEQGSKIDLSTAESIHEALVSHVNDLTFFESKKKYVKSRELEIHKMVEQGCMISTEDFWNSLKEVIK